MAYLVKIKENNKVRFVALNTSVEGEEPLFPRIARLLGVRCCNLMLVVFYDSLTNCTKVARELNSYVEA